MTKLCTLILGYLLIGSAYGKSISCQTNYDEYSLKIDQDTVALQQVNEEGQRAVASSGIQSRNLPKQVGLAKVFYKNGLKYKVNIAHLEAFSDVDDYLVVTSAEGHQMTYPLNCRI